MSYPTQEIPTDRHGNPYYGPRTVAEAEKQIQEGADREEVAEMLDRAGYTGVAGRVRAKGRRS